MQKIELCIFDVDGLCLDSERPFVEFALDFVKRHGYDQIDLDYITSSMGQGQKESREFALKRLGPDFPIEEYASKLSKEAVENNKGKIFAVKKGLLELLAFLKEHGIKTAVATSRVAKSAVRDLINSGLSDKFDYILCGDDVPRSKPYPDIYLNVINNFHCAPADALVFEDSHNGLKSAMAANIPCILVPDVAKLTKEDHNNAFRVIPSLDKAIDIIKEINQL